jgi:hypothetical protein
MSIFFTSAVFQYPAPTDCSIYGCVVKSSDCAHDIICGIDSDIFKAVEECLKKVKTDDFTPIKKMCKINGHDYEIMVKNNPKIQGFHELIITQTNIKSGKERRIKLLGNI